MRLRYASAWLVILLANASYVFAQPASNDWGLPQLMHDLAQVHSASARFSERETLQMLSAPLLTSGTLIYVAPDYVRKTTLTPVPEDFTLDHGQVTMSGGTNSQTQQVSLSDQPQIAGLVEGVRATLAGDLPTLQRFYDVRLTGTADNWQLLLKPKSAELSHFIKSIIIQGSQDRVTAIDTVSSNGDHTEMGIAETVSDAR